MITRARSLRRVEERTGQIVKKHGSFLGIKRRIADNTLGRIVPRLDPVQICAALHRQVKAENRRGNLKPDRLPIATAAIDGKNIATLRWHELCPPLSARSGQGHLGPGQGALGKELPPRKALLSQRRAAVWARPGA